MKILITGSEGQLGRDLLRVFNEEEVAAFDLDLDITDLDAVKKEFKRFKPDVILNSAAYTDVDGCETNAETAFKVNAIGAANLALASKEVGSSILHVSTDYVFDGKKNEPYIETDRVNPQSVYGKTKLAGELAVTALMNKYYIVRTAWLYGHGGNNFVKTIQKLAKEKDQLKVVNDQQGSPTFTLDLANKIAEVIRSSQFGIYHITDSGSCTWFEFAKEIFNLSGIKAEISPCSTDEFPRPAKRPAYSVLANRNLELRGFSPMRPWTEALRSYFGKDG